MRSLGAGAFTLIFAAAASGCFAEIATGVTPSMESEVAATTMTTTDPAWTLELAIGFHLDIWGVGLGYSPGYGDIVNRPGGESPDVKQDGHHVRLDVDVPITRRIRTRATAAYTSARTVTFGDLERSSGHGQAIFAGMSVATRRERAGFVGLATVGVSYVSIGATTPTSEVSQSGFGMGARFMVQWQPPHSLLPIPDKVYWDPTETTPASTIPFTPSSSSPEQTSTCAGGYYRTQPGSCDADGNNCTQEWYCP